MATITFTNALANNPGIEDVLDKSPTIGTHDGATLNLINNNGGVANGFVFRLSGSGFTYGGPGGTPDGGTISDVTILDGSANIVATITGTLALTSLSAFWTALQNGALSVLQVLDSLLQVPNTVDGAGGADHLTAFGSSANTLSGGAGDDVLWARADATDTLIGGTGNDVLRIDGTPSVNFHGPVAVHGSAQDGSGGVGETDVLAVTQVNVSFSTITNIDGLRFGATANGNIVNLLSGQIGIGLVSPTLAVQGAVATFDQITMTRSGTGAVNLDLSGWTFTQFSATNQIVRVDLSGDAVTPQNDHVIGTAANDVILTGFGDDIIELRGGLASVLQPGAFDNTANAGAGNDTVTGGINNDLIVGGDGNDVLRGGGGQDELHGDDGDDQLLSGLNEGPTGAQTLLLDGGAGTDFVFFDRSNSARSYTLDLGDPLVGSDLGDGTTVINVERVEFRAGLGNDVLAGGALADVLLGGAGRDFLAGGGGNDTLDGGSGIDNIDGGDGDDLITGGAGADSIDGGNGADTANYAASGAGVTINLLSGVASGGDAAGDTLANIENLIGTSFDDTFTVDGSSHVLAGSVGNDTVIFNFKLTDAAFGWSGNQVLMETGSGHIVLSGFETFVFTDGTVNNNDGNPLVDDLFYYARYHDAWNAHADADQQYASTGWREGRDPNAFFSTSLYREFNPDVAAAGVDPLKHFDTAGWSEGRLPSPFFDPAKYLAADPDVAAAHVDPLAHFLQFGAQEGRLPFFPDRMVDANGFDYVYYLQHNPDVAAARVDPLRHFQTFGWHEGRNPNALFDTAGYLATYGDVAAAHINPLEHYNAFGWHEGRDPSVGFDTTSYLAAYPDVAAAHVNPLVHLLQFGIHEGRAAFADGVWG